VYSDDVASDRLIRQGEQNAHRAVLFLQAYFDEHGYAPSMRELAAELGMSAMGARDILRRLDRDGMVEVTPGVPRGIALTRKEWSQQ